ncbi:hypothetical protein ALC56_03666 [Trachymyrmex septentrionalis]|uniref:Uncharacterized protein n=1 Tax=Trachymyrmex septentrionalis TaxID=34720 RepID=A0A151JZ72_9HYME|nr:hypothetical protein ALC56_03666 [Trachymyrmex septentrionalis]
MHDSVQGLFIIASVYLQIREIRFANNTKNRSRHCRRYNGTLKIPSFLQIVPTTFFAVMSFLSRIQTEDAFVRGDAKKKKKIRDLTVPIYTKERCREARRKCTTPWMAFSRIYFYRVKTFVVAFVDESILFQVHHSLPPSLSRGSFSSS